MQIMNHLSALSREAKILNAQFTEVFYWMVGLLIVLGVLIELFKIPLGNGPMAGEFSIAKLLFRAIIAVFLLSSFNEVANLLSAVTESIANSIGSFNDIKLVTAKYSEKLSQTSMKWISIKEYSIMLVSYVCFGLVYFSVYLSEALLIFTWTLCYVLAPLFIALFTLESTSQITWGLYRSMIEASLWKIVWSILAVLLWSTALTEINSADSSFLTLLFFALILSASMVATPLVVHLLMSGGISSVAKSAQALALPSAALSFKPLVSKSAGVARNAGQASKEVIQKVARESGLSRKANNFSRNQHAKFKKMLSSKKSTSSMKSHQSTKNTSKKIQNKEIGKNVRKK